MNFPRHPQKQLWSLRLCCLMVIFLALGVPEILWPQGGLPEKLIGSWLGEGTQVSPSMSWTIRMDLYGGPKGAVVGKISYPSLGCGGELVLQNVRGDSAELLEVIKYQGGGNCLSRGTIRLQLTGREIRFSYSHPSNRGTSSATLEPLDEEEGQRDKARRIACSAPAGSLGKEAICPNLEIFYVRWWGNFCAGEVGDLYEKNRRELEQPVTDTNIEKWAKMETKYFQSYGGCTADLGRRLSQDDRVRWMKEARDDGSE